jgi:uncharacterized protein (DUF885 family)
MLRVAIILAIGVATAACGGATNPPPADPEPADTRVRTLADAYVSGFFDQFPEQATVYGLKDRRHDRLSDISPASRQKWEAQEDRWLADVRAIDPAGIDSRSLRATYEILREALEASVASRVCRSELWNVSQMTGWQVGLGYVVTIQPTGSDQARQEAIARWRSLPTYLDAEIANLREGMKLGYTAPKHIVRIVIASTRTLSSAPVEESPFFAPATADKTPAFQQQFRTIVAEQIAPAIRRYTEFLEREYLPAAREAIAVAANPNGAACYQASIRAASTLPKTPQEVHDTGLREVARLDGEMKAIAERSFATGDVPALMQRLRTDRQYTFRSRDELINYSKAALDRARAAVPQWFGIVPKADVRIEPYPAFREKSGAPGEYNPPAEDGSRSGLFYINAWQPEKTTRSDNESTAFHETIPGHHLQIAIALERRDNHPLARYLFNGGYVEGWALYAEQLADEMKLYTGDLDRLGMLSSQNWRASRLVVDTGLHALGWTRQQAIDYMLAHTPQSAESAASEVDRYIIMPGQATSYMLGRLEIVAARDEMRKAEGNAFDIKRFHDRVLEDGAVPLTYLRAKLRAR